jgi:hypothetical protein
MGSDSCNKTKQNPFELSVQDLTEIHILFDLNEMNSFYTDEWKRMLSAVNYGMSQSFIEDELISEACVLTFMRHDENVEDGIDYDSLYSICEHLSMGICGDTMGEYDRDEASGKIFTHIEPILTDYISVLLSIREKINVSNEKIKGADVVRKGMVTRGTSCFVLRIQF